MVVVIVETPKGSHEKIKFDEKSQQFIINKVLPDGMNFPFNFGFVPQTKGEDGDPLDVIIISDKAYASGTDLSCRIIGCLTAKQTLGSDEIRNDRFLAVPEKETSFSDVTRVDRLPAGTIEDYKSFFKNYLAAEGKQITFINTIDATDADSLLQLAKQV